MKTSVLLLLLSFCFASFGAVVIIRGQPTPLEYQNEMYYWPINFVIQPSTTTFYITMDGIDKICFANRAPNGLFEQVSEINIIIHGVKTQWNCFPYRTVVLPALP